MLSLIIKTITVVRKLCLLSVSSFKRIFILWINSYKYHLDSASIFSSIYVKIVTNCYQLLLFWIVTPNFSKKYGFFFLTKNGIEYHSTCMERILTLNTKLIISLRLNHVTCILFKLFFFLVINYVVYLLHSYLLSTIWLKNIYLVSTNLECLNSENKKYFVLRVLIKYYFI